MLGLHRGVAHELRFGAQRKERQHQLVERGHGGMGEDDGLLRIDAAGQVVDDHVAHVIGDVLGGVAVGDDLVVGDDDTRGDARVLQLDALADGAEVVTHVQSTRGAVAREHGVLLGVHGEVGFDLVADLLGRVEGVAHGFGAHRMQPFPISLEARQRL